MNKERLAYLLNQLATNSLSFVEKGELKAFVSVESNREAFIEAASELNVQCHDFVDFDDKKWAPVINAVTGVDKSLLSKSGRQAQSPVHRSHLLKTAWFRYAAAIIILAAGAGLYFWNNKAEQTSIKKSAQAANYLALPDVAPGGDRAILTLSDGSTIMLDAAANGTLADQGGVKINKRSNGEIEYSNAPAASPPAVLYNTMSTPRGGQYQIVLPDGSKVWLNAASSITYPTAFVGKDRRVSITGEVYFEVAKNETMPFHVEAHDVDIRVLGTHFNVNAYADEDILRTTLLEGSVQLVKYGRPTVIKPGQQAQWAADDNDPIKVSEVADMAQVMAWQRGFFEFSNIDLVAIMRQVSRWYDVEVVLKKNYSLKKFSGGISRKLPLSNLLKMLEANGLNFKLEGKLLEVI